MDLSTSLIDIDSVEVDNGEAEFTPEKKVALESLAHSIANLKGLITLPIVLKKGIESYKLISGHFEYNAFIKARELDSDLPDRIRVFIIDDENIQLTLEQLKTIENVRSSEKNVDNTVPLELGNIKSKIQILEKNLSNIIRIESNQVRSEILQKIQDLLPKPLPPLEAFNYISDPIVYSAVVKKIEFLGKKKAKKIADRLKEIENPEHNKFCTFGDVLAELGKGYISKEKMLDIIDNW